jgi:hypothetical protein
MLKSWDVATLSDRTEMYVWIYDDAGIDDWIDAGNYATDFDLSVKIVKAGANPPNVVMPPESTTCECGMSLSNAYHRKITAAYGLPCSRMHHGKTYENN